MSVRSPKPASPAPASRPALRSPLRWREREGVLWIESDLRHATAAFSTRCGGASAGPYDSLNLGILTDDDPLLVARNRTLLASGLGRDPGAFAMGLQVHGAAVERHLEPPRPSPYVLRGAKLSQADAQVTSDPEVTPLVLAADCVPVVLALEGAVAVVHCGWRGVVAGILGNALREVCELSGNGAERASAGLGPAIGPCCYTVGPEVVERFRARGHERALNDGRLDLANAVRQELERAGLPAESICQASLCTSCHRDLFFSHRRDAGVTGRQAGVAWLNA